MRSGTLVIVSGLALLFLYLWAGERLDNERPYRDIRIAFLIGGAQGQEFSDQIERGMRAAARDLGCEVVPMWTQWEEETLLKKMKRAVETGYDGICLIGHPGQESFHSFVAEARQSGITVTGYNVPMPDLQRRYYRDGFGYAGEMPYTAGQTLAQAAIHQLRLTAGTRVLIAGVFTERERSRRAQGVEDVLTVHGIEVDKIDTVKLYEQEDAPPFDEVLEEYVSSHPDVRLIICDAVPASTIAQELEERNVPPGQIQIATFDLTRETLRYVDAGYVSLVQDQLPFLQGYLPVLQVCLSRRYSIPGMIVDLSSTPMSKLEIDQLRPLILEGLR